MDDDRKRLVAIVLLLAVLILAWFRRVDRYPTAGDCADVATGHQDRELPDQQAAGAYVRDCGQAASKQQRQEIVDRMSDAANLNASRP